MHKIQRIEEWCYIIIISLRYYIILWYSISLGRHCMHEYNRHPLLFPNYFDWYGPFRPLVDQNYHTKQFKTDIRQISKNMNWHCSLPLHQSQYAKFFELSDLHLHFSYSLFDFNTGWQVMSIVEVVEIDCNLMRFIGS